MFSFAFFAGKYFHPSGKIPTLSER